MLSDSTTGEALSGHREVFWEGGARPSRCSCCMDGIARERRARTCAETRLFQNIILRAGCHPELTIISPPTILRPPPPATKCVLRLRNFLVGEVAIRYDEYLNNHILARERDCTGVLTQKFAFQVLST